MNPVFTWQRYFFYRKELIKTTWKFRIILLIITIIFFFISRDFWVLHIGQSLVCREEVLPVSAILIENFDPNYLVFERAATLLKAGIANRVIVPTEAAKDSVGASMVSQGIAELMARIAHVSTPEILPIQILEPISLHAAYQIRDFLIKERLNSVIVVTEGFRSKRSALIYRSILEPAGIKAGCVPVFGQTTPANWGTTWHGIQEVTEQFFKLQYYRFYVLRAYML